MRAEIDRREISRILELFHIDDRRQVREYCRDLVLDCEALFQVILAGRYAGLHSYVYDCHFSSYSQSLVSPEDRDLAALAANGIVPLHLRAVKATRKVARSVELEGTFAAHVLYTPCREHWHLFCFHHHDAGDSGPDCTSSTRVAYSRAQFTRAPLREVWRKVCNDNHAPRSLPIRCECRSRIRQRTSPSVALMSA